MFWLDGESFDDTVRIVSLTEKFEILNGNNSGRTQDGNMYIEAIGTYFNYTIVFERKVTGDLREWDRFKNILANPDNRHTITVLRDQGLLEDYEVYVSGGQRELLKTKRISEREYESYWGDLSIDFISMKKFDY